MLPRIDRLFRGYIFDLDGTIWLTDRLVPGAAETVATLRSRGSHPIFLTNNSVGTRETFAERLTALGIRVAPSEIVSTSFVMAEYLRATAPGCRCYVIGHDPLRTELVAAGMHLSDQPGKIDYVVLGVDRDFSYRKLQTAFEAIRAGARFAATNADPYSPSCQGDLADIGAMIAAIEVATDHRLDAMIGKPNPYIVETALSCLGLTKDECLMVGDQLNTDVLAGRRAGIPTAFLMRDPRVVAQLGTWDGLPDYGLERLLDLIAWEASKP